MAQRLWHGAEIPKSRIIIILIRFRNTPSILLGYRLWVIGDTEATVLQTMIFSFSGGQS
jgi:hypothetical protein